MEDKDPYDSDTSSIFSDALSHDSDSSVATTTSEGDASGVEPISGPAFDTSSNATLTEDHHGRSMIETT